MNATTPTHLRIASTTASATTVEAWGIEFECEYEYEPGEDPILWPTESAHPGSPANAVLLSCKVGGVEITDMLSEHQRERLEEGILSELEGSH